MSESRRHSEEQLLGAVLGMSAIYRLEDPLSFIAGIIGNRRRHVQDVATGMQEDGTLKSTTAGYELNFDHPLATAIAEQPTFTVRRDIEITREELTGWVDRQAEIDAAQRQLRTEMRARLIGQVATVAP